MSYPIEILTTDPLLIADLEKIIQPLNKVQQEFKFEIAKPHIMVQALAFQLEAYTCKQVRQWLENYRVANGGNRPFLLLVINKPLSGEMGNLYGSHDAENGMAWFTTEIFNRDRNQFLFDKIRFCRYYFVRYIISFVNPDITSHPTANCMFDKKIDKKDLLLSLNTGNICDPCRIKFRSSSKYNFDIQKALDKLLQVVSNHHPLALVMKGGGVKGLALIGALKELEKYFSFDTFAGTSAGAITAALLGAGYTPDEMEIILRQKDFNSFKDSKLKVCYNFIRYFALHSGDHFRDWLEGLLKQRISKQDDVTMQNLKHRTIIYATTPGTGLLRFDTNGSRKETSVAFAARCSMSIPFFFKPMKIEGKKVYDGGVGNNFPLRSFIADNKNSLFIGLYLTSDTKKNGNLYDNLSDIVTDSDERQIVDQNLEKIVIIDPRPIQTKQFDLTENEKSFLLQAGKVGALNYLHKYHPDFRISNQEVKDEQLIFDNLRKLIKEDAEFKSKAIVIN